MTYVGCTLVLPCRDGRPPVLLHRRTPLAEAVPVSPGVPSGYRVGAFENDWPVGMWEQKLFNDALRHYWAGVPEAANLDPDAELGVDTLQARIWLDELSGSRVLIASATILESKVLLNEVCTIFKLTEDSCRFVVDPTDIATRLLEVGLADETGDVVYDSTIGQVITVSLEGTDGSFQPRPLRPGSYEVDYTQPAPDWVIEKALQL